MKLAECLSLFQTVLCVTDCYSKTRCSVFISISFALRTSSILKMVSFFVVCLKSKRYLVLPQNWIENPVERQESKVFSSPNTEDIPNFELRTLHYVNNAIQATYDAFVLKKFG